MTRVGNAVCDFAGDLRRSRSLPHRQWSWLAGSGKRGANDRGQFADGVIAEDRGRRQGDAVPLAHVGDDLHRCQGTSTEIIEEVAVEVDVGGLGPREWRAPIRP